MITVNFKNLRKSELVKEAILDRLEDDLIRFPDLNDCRVFVTVSMDNSPEQAGPDLFRVKLRITSGRYKGIILEKSGINFYLALAEMNESLLERLNRFVEKKRVKRRGKARSEAKALLA